MIKAGNYHKPLLYLSIFFQSKLRLMTTGGASGVASGGDIVPDRQGEVNTQHRPSAESERVKKGEVKFNSQACKQTQS